MEKTYRNKHWVFEALENDPSINSKYWMMAIYQEEIPEDDDVNVDSSWTSDHCDTLKEAAKSVLDVIWKTSGLRTMADAATALMDLGLLQKNWMINATTAFIDGKLFYGFADDMNIAKQGLQTPDDGLFGWTPLTKFTFSTEGTEIAKKIIDAAVADAKAFAEGYEAWESTWIDGPQWL